MEEAPKFHVKFEISFTMPVCRLLLDQDAEVEPEAMEVSSSDEETEECFTQMVEDAVVINLPTVSILDSNKNYSLFKKTFGEKLGHLNLKLKSQKSAVSEILMTALDSDNEIAKSKTSSTKAKRRTCESSGSANKMRVEEDKDDESENTPNYTNYYNEYSEWMENMQKEEDEREESSMKILHRLRMSNNYKPLESFTEGLQNLPPIQEKPEKKPENLVLQSKCESALAKLPSCKKPPPRKSILKNTGSELYIHSDIEWNEDKKYFRDPIVTQKVIKAREEHVKKLKEIATKEYEREKEELGLSDSSTDSEKDAPGTLCAETGQPLVKRQKSKRKRKTMLPLSKDQKRVQILDEHSVLYIEGRDCLTKMEKELEAEERKMNPPKTKKNKKRRRSKTF